MPHDHLDQILFDEDLTFALGALAVGDVVSQETKIDSARTQGCFLKWLEWTGNFVAKTVTEGPVTWGFATNLSAAGVEQVLENDPSGSQSVISISMDAWVRPMDMLTAAATAGILDPERDGQVSSRHFLRIRRSVNEGSALSVWARNLGATPLTTGTILTFSNMYSYRWRRD